MSLSGIDAYLVFASDSAEAGNIHDARDGFELLLQRPVLERFQLHVVVRRIGAVQRVPVDLADRAPIGARSAALQSRGQRDLGQPFQDLFAVPVIDGVVVENQRKTGKARERGGAEMLHVRNTRHHNFQRNGHLLLDLFGRAAGPLGDDR